MWIKTSFFEFDTGPKLRVKKQSTTPVLILGMHRNGTTMVAEALNSAGVYAGAICDHNREALYAVDLNERMLEAAGGKWWQPPTNDALEQALANFQPELDSTHLYAAHLKVKSGKTWRQKMHYSGPWLIKDPRLCLTLPWWLKRFPEAKVIWVLRDEPSVVSSLLRRQEKSDEAQSELDAAKALELHRTYNAQASATLKAMGWITVPYATKIWFPQMRLFSAKAGLVCTNSLL